MRWRWGLLGGVFLLAGPLSFFWLLDPLMLPQPTDAHLHLPPPQALAALPALTLGQGIFGIGAKPGEACKIDSDCQATSSGLARCGSGICCVSMCLTTICSNIRNGQVEQLTCAAGTGACGCALPPPNPQPAFPGKGGGAMGTAVSGAVVVAALAAAALAAAQ